MPARNPSSPVPDKTFNDISNNDITFNDIIIYKKKIVFLFNFGHLGWQNSLPTQECRTTYLPAYLKKLNVLEPTYVSSLPGA